MVGIIISKIFHVPKFNQWILQNWSRLLLHVCGLTVSTYGDLPSQPTFILANHVSWLDIPVVHSLILAGFVGKHEIKYWPILGWLAMLGDTIFLKRGNQNSRQLVIQTLIKHLKKGRSVAVFPEGRVTDGTHLGRFHRQLVHAAVLTNTPITPVAIKFLTQSRTRNADVCFKNNEWFILHVWRILSLPSSFVEIHCGPQLTGDSARSLTMQAHQFVENKLLENDYLPTTHKA